MKNETVHIDDLLNVSFAGFEPTAPAFVWDNIADSLDKKTNRRGFIWWKAAIIVAVIAGLGSLVLVNKNQSTEIAESNVMTDKSNSNSKQAENPTTEKSVLDQNNTEKQIQSGSNDQTRSTFRTNRIFEAAKNTPTPQPEVDRSTNLHAINHTDQTSAFAKLKSFGIRQEALALEQMDELNALPKLQTDIVPPTNILGGHFWVGFGAGQVMSATALAVNPSFSNYVHKNYTKHQSAGEGLMAAMNFAGTLAYKLSGKHYLYTGANFYQRRNSLNFNFTDEAPAINAVGNVKKDIFGNYPIKGYVQAGSGVAVNFTGSNTFTNIEIPLGWMAQYPFGRGLTFIPSAAAGLGFLSLNSNNSTLNYQLLEVEKVHRDWYRKSYLMMNTSAGVYKDLGLRIKWGLNASAGYTLSQMYLPGSPVRPRAFTGGLTTQIIWRLD